MGRRGYSCKSKGPGRLPEDSLEPRLERGEDRSFAVIRETCPQQRNSRCESPDRHIGVCLVGWRNVQEACVARGGGNHWKTIGLNQFLSVSRNSKLACYPRPLTPCATRPSVTQSPGLAQPLCKPPLIVRLGHLTHSDECNLQG